MNYRKILLEVFIIVFLSLAIGILFNQTRTTPLNIIVKVKDKKVSTVKKYDEKIITADELSYYLTQSEAVIFDARDADLYEIGHIPFAISLPIRQFEIKFKKVKGVLGRLKTIIVYCTGVNCHDSTELAKKLNELGYLDVFVYKGGITEWKDELHKRIEVVEK